MFWAYLIGWFMVFGFAFFIFYKIHSLLKYDLCSQILKKPGNLDIGFFRIPLRCFVNPLCMWYDRNEEDYLYSMRKLQIRIKPLLNPSIFSKIPHVHLLSIWL